MRIFTIIFAVMAATFATSASAVTQNFDFRESTYRVVFPANQPVTKTSNRGLDVDVSSFNGPPTDLFFDARGTGANTLVDTNGNPVALFCGNPGCSTLFLNFDVPVALLTLRLVLYTTTGANVDVALDGVGVMRQFLPPTDAADLPQEFVLDYTGVDSARQISIKSGGTGNFSLARLTVDDLAPVPLPAGLPLLAGSVGALMCLRKRRQATSGYRH